MTLGRLGCRQRPARGTLHVCMHACVCVRVCVCVCVYVYVAACMYVWTHACICMGTVGADAPHGSAKAIWLWSWFG